MSRLGGSEPGPNGPGNWLLSSANVLFVRPRRYRLARHPIDRTLMLLGELSALETQEIPLHLANTSNAGGGTNGARLALRAPLLKAVTDDGKVSDS